MMSLKVFMLLIWLPAATGQFCFPVCSWLTWETWSCSATCGGGTGTRTRKPCCFDGQADEGECLRMCEAKPADMTETSSCNEFCMNGGVFTEGSCTCPPCFTGSCCETGPCFSNPCQNGGTCENKGNIYTCICPDGYKGDYCEGDPNPCSSYPCQNEGNCTNNGNNYTCACKKGYGGMHCEVKPPTAEGIKSCDENRCKNNGTCELISTEPYYRCKCKSTLSGELCEDIAVWVYVVAVMVLIIIMVIIALVIYCVCPRPITRTIKPEPFTNDTQQKYIEDY